MEQNLEAAGKSSVKKKPQTTKNFTTLANKQKQCNEQAIAPGFSEQPDADTTLRT